jgi:ribose 5-phosphate isomerase A
MARSECIARIFPILWGVATSSFRHRPIETKEVEHVSEDKKTPQKRAAAAKALEWVDFDQVIGIGSGSTVAEFIRLLAPYASRIPGVVVASTASEKIAREVGLRVVELNDVAPPESYFDGADEIEPGFAMIKGGGAALTREKIIGSASRRFVCLVDESKLVDALGAFALPVEAIPMARTFVMNRLQQLGGTPHLRGGIITDNGNILIDVSGLKPINPRAMEEKVNAIPGVVCNGIFALRRADELIVAGETVRHLREPVRAWSAIA